MGPGSAVSSSGSSVDTGCGTEAGRAPAPRGGTGRGGSGGKGCCIAVVGSEDRKSKQWSPSSLKRKGKIVSSKTT
jgi:hypothetical protein